MSKLFILFYLILCCCSCGGDEQTVYSYIALKNCTDFKIKIKGFDKGKLKKEVDVEPNNTKKLIVQASLLNNYLGVSDDLLDSVNIIFDEKKIVTQYCNGKYLMECPAIIKNVFTEYEVNAYPRGRLKFSLKSNKIRYYKKPIEIIFDQSDYDRAVPIKK
jgi:hypothetical protein